MTNPYHPEGLDECYCDNGHKAVNTVCMWCWERGRREWNDMEVSNDEQAA